VSPNPIERDSFSAGRRQLYDRSVKAESHAPSALGASASYELAKPTLASCLEGDVQIK
jgi:hypothetical protein